MERKIQMSVTAPKRLFIFCPKRAGREDIDAGTDGA